MPDLRERSAIREGISDEDWEPRNTSTVSPNPQSLVNYRMAPRQINLPFLDGKLVMVCEGPMPAWLKAVVAKLDELASLPPNWNSYRAAPMKRFCLLAAVQLLVATMRDNSPTPAVVPTNRGTVLLEWHKRGIDLEIDVLGLDRFHVVVDDTSREIEWESDVGGDLTEIVQVIKRLS